MGEDLFFTALGGKGGTKRWMTLFVFAALFLTGEDARLHVPCGSYFSKLFFWRDGPMQLCLALQ